MIRVVLLLPTVDLKQVKDEQGIALIASYLRENGYYTDMIAVEGIKDLNSINFSEYSLVGMTAYHENLPQIYEISEYIKKRNESIWICIGGVLCYLLL